MAKKTLISECTAEALGTFLFVFLGIASVAVLIITDVDISYWEMAIVWGVAVALGVYCTGHISGGHLNPAVTISLAIWSNFPSRKVGPYITAQIAGAFLAAVCNYVLYRSVITGYEQTHSIVRNTVEGIPTANVFVTFPAENLDLFTAFFVEFFITAILMLVILAVTNNKNIVSSGLGALLIGLSIAVCGLAFGPLTGFAMNPARDFGPRILTLLAGWEGIALGPNNYGLIVPIFGPILGAVFAGLLYFKVLIPTFGEKITFGDSKVKSELNPYVQAKIREEKS